MRVIAGEYKRRRLEAPPGMATRPSSDRLRETLFNILGAHVNGAIFVDAYAGSGAVGIEAFSRGARPVVWIEQAAAALLSLRRNLSALGIGPAGRGPIPGAEAVVIAQPVIGALAKLRTLPAVVAQGGCDLFFLDPPYARERERDQLLQTLDQGTGLVRPGGCVIAETRHGASPLQLRRLRCTRTHPQGDSQLVFYTVVD